MSCRHHEKKTNLIFKQELRYSDYARHFEESPLIVFSRFENFEYFEYISIAIFWLFKLKFNIWLERSKFWQQNNERLRICHHLLSLNTHKSVMFKQSAVFGEMLFKKQTLSRGFNNGKIVTSLKIKFNCLFAQIK